ncbi:unnamed protein product [Bursaphelenchus okinawaensis]|uniref:RGM domain family member B n=1 Tax=Bursaphelenchus okinawaensis TaxID=465554 RepID=A0A811JWP3_9BILA|nr:unnamed protein product [Bursaphelenchus okinawaensis]CAG9086534.1 unnamed protein product [Bursaphelenchus okinawaensis]
MAKEAISFQLNVGHKYLVVVILMSSTFVSSCNVDDCTTRYNQLMNDRVLNPSETPEYCTVLYEYVQCLTSIQNVCRSYLHFHSSLTAANQRWKRFRCASFSLSSIDKGEDEQRCSTIPRQDQRTCAFFGRSHLRRTDGAIETCAEIGTRPLIDNKFVVVQVTMNPETYSQYPITVISKVTIIFRSNSLCEETRTYHADAEEPHLPNAFTDGTTFAGTDNDPPLSIAKRNETTVRLLVPYLATEIVIHKVSNRLDVVINTPEKVLHLEYHDAPLRQLCLTGCTLAVHNVREAVQEGNVFAKCQGIKRPELEKEQAYDLCRQDYVRGDLHSSCAFDLLYGQNLQYTHQPMSNSTKSVTIEEWHTVIRTLRYFDALKSTRTRSAMNSVRRLDRTRIPFLALVLVLAIVIAQP